MNAHTGVAPSDGVVVWLTRRRVNGRSIPSAMWESVIVSERTDNHMTSTPCTPLPEFPYGRSVDLKVDRSHGSPAIVESRMQVAGTTPQRQSARNGTCQCTASRIALIRPRGSRAAVVRDEPISRPVTAGLHP